MSDSVKLATSEFNTRSTVTSSPPSIIIFTIQRLEIDEAIKNIACATFVELAKHRIDCKTKSVKNTHKLSLIFYCVYTGFIKTGNIVDPYFVAKLVGLSKSHVDSALNCYSNYGCTMFKPEDALLFYIKNLNEQLKTHGMSFDIDAVHQETLDIIRCCRMTPKGDDWITQTSSRIVCISVIYFYLNDIKQLPMNKHVEDFEKACFTTKACIIKYYMLLVYYYNSVNDDTNTEGKNGKKFCALTLFDSDED